MMLSLIGTPLPCRQHWLGALLQIFRRRFCWSDRLGRICAMGLVLGLPRVLIGASAPLLSHNYAINFYNVYAGLAANTSPVTRQTSDGYIWIGTELGLSRFDGVQFVNYRVANTPAMQANHIRNLFEDREGWLWIATQKGLCRQRQGKFERIGLDGSAVIGTAQNHAGSIWIGTGDKGLWEYRDGRLISHSGAPGMPPNPENPVVTLLFVDSHDRVWFGPTDNVRIYDGHIARPLDLKDPPFKILLRVAETVGEVFWFDTDKGLFRLDRGEFRRYGVEQGLGNELIRNMVVDPQGRLWVFTSTLYMMEKGAEHFVQISIPGVENPRSILEDFEGSYWIGTAGDGAARVRPSGFRMLTPENGLLGGNTRTVAVDREGAVWAGLSIAGLARISPQGETTVISTGDGSSGEVWSVLPASDGQLWIGTCTSLRVLRDGRQQEFPQFQRIRALFEDRNGTIWIGSENEGVTCYRDGKFISMVEVIKAHQPLQPEATVPIAMAFAEDKDGSFYIGLRETGGLVKIKEGAVTVFHASDGFPTNDIRAIYPDDDGNLWLGTKGRGLAVFTAGRWWNPEVLSEAFNDLVSTILEDEKGNLWLGTPKGIMWAPKAKLLALARGQLLHALFPLAVESDGVRPAVVGAGTFPSAYKAADGTLWFGTRRGLTKVEPFNIQVNQVPPPVQIERVLVDNKSVPTHSEIRLSPGTRALTIDYTALSFVGPTRVLFRYRLEGHDPDWTDVGTRRTAFYTNLEPGSFRFHVIACNDDGVWNETGASIAVVQLPFFYQTKWFYGLVALGVAGSGIGMVRRRTAALKQRNLELEQGIAERTRELAASYDAIRASEYFYHSLIESLPQVIVRKDTKGRFTYANRGFSELIDRPLDQIIGKLESEVYSSEKAEKFRRDDQRAIETHQTLEYERIAELAGRPPRYLHVKKVPLYDQQGQALGVQILFWDMTTFREIEERLKQAQRELVETSRLAGIAEMATGILHNLGNALNSVNITTSSTLARMRRSRIDFVAKTAQLLAEHSDRLPEFFSSDPRGRKLPAYLTELAAHLAQERDEALADLQGLQASVDHIKELVASQQQYARVAGVTEVLPASELVEHALRAHEASLEQHGIKVIKEFADVPLVKVERQKALQIIGNLLVNAEQATVETERSEKQITLGIRRASQEGVQIYINDNGVGIAPENLTRIFAFGFTTKKTGHGFGLHSSALAAKEMGGSLNGFSDGLDRGATFVLELLPAPVD